ncbi:hypothetical protein ABZT02_17045 [Streptomyces sp. NPDC005402]|uniref:hypothetical protein n=1 Tax=Streptomyces sp. NPDC005402 TaxID=3155338 RepID=UPI00339FEEC8
MLVWKLRPMRMGCFAHAAVFLSRHTTSRIGGNRYEIGVERLDRAVLGELDACLRHEPSQEIGLLPEDPMHGVMW